MNHVLNKTWDKDKYCPFVLLIENYLYAPIYTSLSVIRKSNLGVRKVVAYDKEMGLEK